MRISPINNFSVQNNQTRNSNNTPFKGIVLDRAIKATKIPNDAHEWGDVWSSLLNAVKKEYGVRILNQNMFDDLMKFRGYNAQYASAFFYNHNIEGNPDGTAIAIARDDNDVLMALAKDETGCYIEFNGTEEVRRLGFTHDIGDYKYSYYQAPGVYVDFYNLFDTDGGPRRISLAGSDDRFYRADGSRDIFGGFRNFVSEVRNIFKS